MYQIINKMITDLELRGRSNDMIKIYVYTIENFSRFYNKSPELLGAIMHKIVRYIFSVIKKQKLYEERHPEIHCRMFLTHTAWFFYSI